MGHAPLRAVPALGTGARGLDAQDRIIFANHAARETLGRAETLFEEPFDAALARADLKAEGQGEQLLHYRNPGAAPRFFDVTDSAVQNDRRAARTIVLRDITRAQQQADTLREQNESQRRLLELVATLETPVTTLADGVALAPVVGHLDSRRGSALTSRLLQAIYAQRLRCCIIDISGVATIDTAVAQTLVQAIQALRLLGCDVAVTGIGPTVAQMLTQLGISFGSVLTTRSPQEALAWALERQSERRI
jgi:anti-anti-sigma regulatory factor